MTTKKNQPPTPQLLSLNEGDRIQFDPQKFVLEENSFSVDSLTIYELKSRTATPTEDVSFANAQKAIENALAAMRKVKAGRETSLVVTKLQEAQHWLASSREQSELAAKRGW